MRASYEFALEHKGFFSQLPAHTGQNNFRESFVRYSNELICRTCVGDGLADDECLLRTMMIDIFSYGIVGLFLDSCATGLAWPIESLLEAQEQVLPRFRSRCEHRVRWVRRCYLCANGRCASESVGRRLLRRRLAWYTEQIADEADFIRTIKEDV